MNIQRVPLSELKQPMRNVRVHSRKQMDEYGRSLKKFGQTKPIVCDENYVIIAGNGLYLAMKEHGDKYAWCNIIAGLSDADKKKLMLADNKVYELGITDHNAIDEILKELDGDFDIPGYDDSMLEMLTMSFSETDDMVNSYGIFSPTDIERIQQRSTAAQGNAETPQGASGENRPLSASAAGAQERPPQDAKSGNFVICPKCGERICL